MNFLDSFVDWYLSRQGKRSVVSKDLDSLRFKADFGKFLAVERISRPYRLMLKDFIFSVDFPQEDRHSLLRKFGFGHIYHFNSKEFDSRYLSRGYKDKLDDLVWRINYYDELSLYSFSHLIVRDPSFNRKGVYEDASERVHDVHGADNSILGHEVVVLKYFPPKVSS